MDIDVPVRWFSVRGMFEMALSLMTVGTLEDGPANLIKLRVAPASGSDYCHFTAITTLNPVIELEIGLKQPDQSEHGGSVIKGMMNILLEELPIRNNGR